MPAAVHAAQMSPALQSFLQQEVDAAEPGPGQDDALVSDALAPLGDLDITTSDTGLQGGVR